MSISYSDKYPYVIAEAGVNHNGDLETAFRLMRAAKFAGANAIKYQVFSPEELVTPTLEKAKYQKENTGQGTQFSMLSKLALPISDFKKLYTHAKGIGIDFIVTPYSVNDAKQMADSVDAFKISSGDITHTPLIKEVLSYNLPVILSTGMASLSDIDRIASIVKKLSNKPDIYLLHCVSAYPCSPNSVNLPSMERLKAFGYPVGYSDHTEGIGVPVAAVSLGATIIEKHLTLDRNMSGPDHKMAMDPTMFKHMIEECLKAHKAVTPACFIPSEGEDPITARRSLKAAKFLKKGTVLSVTDFKILRPATGLPPYYIDMFTGLTTTCDIEENDDILWKNFK